MLCFSALYPSHGESMLISLVSQEKWSVPHLCSPTARYWTERTRSSLYGGEWWHLQVKENGYSLIDEWERKSNKCLLDKKVTNKCALQSCHWENAIAELCKQKVVKRQVNAPFHILHALNPRWIVDWLLLPGPSILSAPETLYTPHRFKPACGSSWTDFSVYVCFASSLSSATSPIGERLWLQRSWNSRRCAKKGRKMTIQRRYSE